MLAFKWHANVSLYVLFVEGLCVFYAAVVPGPCGFSIWRLGFFLNCFFGLLHLLDTSSLHETIDSN